MSVKKASTGTPNRVKDPDDWVTGDEAITGAQEIDRLQEKTGRGRRVGAKRASRPKRNN